MFSAFKQIKAGKIAATVTVAASSFLAFSHGAYAQATVRDSSPISPGQSAPAAEGATTSNSLDCQMINQLQQLQQEILELRGLVEEQAFEIKRLKQQRLDDYLDLDKRISALSQSQSNSGGSTSSTPATLSGGSVISNSASDDAKEKALYREAIDLLLSKQDYAGAQSRFNQYLKEYPQGSYAPNVHYWQGQIYTTENNQKSAETAFLTLIQDYPNHAKTPDAKYKLATLYYGQGKKSEAKSLLDDVAAGDSDASRLAKAFLAKQYP